jgi:hypothetical protein
MKYSRGIVAATLAVGLLALAPAQQAAAHHKAASDAGVISQWDQIGMATILADNGTVPPRKQPVEAFLYLAFLNAAMYNAVVGIEGGYEPYRFHARAPRHASPQAAAVAAAHRILVTYSPEQAGTLDTDYAGSLAAIKDGKAKTRGIAYGELAATTLIAQRAHDGRNAPIVFDKAPVPGIWRPTPPAKLPFSAPWLAFVTPLLLHSSDQFDPGPPPSLTSRRYAKDFNEVKAMGRVDSTSRTAEQTATARFFSGSAAVQFTAALADQAMKRDLDIVDSARMFAAVSMSVADASIAVWWTKYHYGAWRPVTAIQVVDPTWTSLIPSPPYPDYVSGYNGVMGAFTQALEDTLGTRHVALTLTSTVTPDVRSFDTGRQARQQVIDARVWLGIHFRFADTAAATMGQQVADYGLEHYFRPVDEDDD